MNKDNDFEIIDDFDDISIDSSLNPVVSNEVPFNEEINKNLEVESNFVFEEEENMSTPSSTQLESPSAAEQDSTFVASQIKEEVSPLGHPAEPLAAPGTVDVMTTTPNLNMDVQSEPTIEESNEQPVEINPVLPNGDPVVTTKETKETEFNLNNKTSKNATKLVFIILLLLIIGVVIIFLPQISSMLKK